MHVISQDHFCIGTSSLATSDVSWPNNHCLLDVIFGIYKYTFLSLSLSNTLSFFYVYMPICVICSRHQFLSFVCKIVTLFSLLVSPHPSFSFYSWVWFIFYMCAFSVFFIVSSLGCVSLWLPKLLKLLGPFELPVPLAMHNDNKYIFGLNYDLERSTMHHKFDPSGVDTHDL